LNNKKILKKKRNWMSKEKKNREYKRNSEFKLLNKKRKKKLRKKNRKKNKDN